MKLIFSEIVINQITIKEDLIKEYLDNCKEVKVFPRKADFLDWLSHNVYIGDLSKNKKYTYTLTESQFGDYLQHINND